MVETQRVQMLHCKQTIAPKTRADYGRWGVNGRTRASENRTAAMFFYNSPVNSSLLFPAYETTPSRPHLALFTCLFLLMSLVGVAMYCTDRRHQQRLCEELEAALAVYLLHMKQLLWGCWIWLTMQWHKQTTGGDEEPVIVAISRPLLFFSYFGKIPGPQTLYTVCSVDLHSE